MDSGLDGQPLASAIFGIVSVSFLTIVAIFYRWYGKHYREPDEVMKLIIGRSRSTS